MVKNLIANAGGIRDMSSIPESGRSPEVGNSNPLKGSCLKNPRGTWRVTVHRVAESDTTEATEHIFCEPLTVQLVVTRRQEPS